MVKSAEIHLFTNPKFGLGLKINKGPLNFTDKLFANTIILHAEIYMCTNPKFDIDL